MVSSIHHTDNFLITKKFIKRVGPYKHNCCGVIPRRCYNLLRGQTTTSVAHKILLAPHWIQWFFIVLRKPWIFWVDTIPTLSQGRNQILKFEGPFHGANYLASRHLPS